MMIWPVIAIVNTGFAVASAALAIKTIDKNRELKREISRLKIKVWVLEKQQTDIDIDIAVR